MSEQLERDPSRRPTDKEWTAELRQRAEATFQAVLRAVQHPTGDPVSLDRATEQIVAGLRALAACWREDAARWETAGKRGGKSTATELRQAASRAAGVAELIFASSSAIRAAGPATSITTGDPVPPAAAPYMPEPTTDEPPRCGHRAADTPNVACVRQPHEEMKGSHVGLDGSRWAYDAPPAPDPNVAPIEAYLTGATDTIPPAAGRVALDPALILSDPTGDFATDAGRIVAAIVPTLDDPAEPYPPFSDWAGVSSDGITWPTGAAPALLDPGPTRLTLAELGAPVLDRPELRRARSASQLSSYVDCGLRYRLDHYHKELPRRPQWSLIGGTAFHRFVELVERGRLPIAGQAMDVAADWTIELDKATDLAARESGMPAAGFRAANGGREGYDWWRVEGESMTQNWLDIRRDRRTLGWTVPEAPWGRSGAIEPMIEWPFEVMIGAVPVVGQIDLVEFHPDHGLQIIDFKTGARVGPYDDATQLAVYDLAVRAILGSSAHELTVAATWFKARTGEWIEPTGWPTREALEYRFAQMDSAERAGVYLARPSSFCAGCQFNSACPVAS